MSKLNKSLVFIVILGIISLFSDMVYEGARGITGPFLESLKANALIVGFFAGLGELIGYGLRLITGYWADRTKKYWTFVFVGYGLNLLSVPLMALAGYWQVAVVLMMMERLGKAIRTPSRDTLMAKASIETGRGWAFGLHEALDQIGATLGPLIMMMVLYFSGNHYPSAFAWTLIPALLALSLLLYSKTKEPESPTRPTGKYQIQGFNDLMKSRVFILYLIAAGLLAAGFTDFPLIAFHLKHYKISTDAIIPALYALAMMVDAISALWIGKLYDRFGIKALMYTILLTMFFPIFAFSGSLFSAITGVVLWGIGMGAQESVLRAVIADMAPQNKVATAFGAFNTVFGIVWFAGSAFMGLLYQYHTVMLISFSIGVQLISAILLLKISKIKN